MEVKLRRFVNVDEPISTYLLSPLEKISVGFRLSWREQKFYKVAKQREANAKSQQRLERQEELKIETLQNLHREITLGGADFITIAFDRADYDNLIDILQTRDFSGFIFRIEPVHTDLLYCYGDDLPIMVSFKPKTIGEVA